MLKVAINNFMRTFYTNKELSSKKNDPVVKDLHEFYVYKELSDKFGALADESKERLEEHYAAKYDDVRRNTTKYDEAQTYIDTKDGFVFSLTSKRAANRLDQVKLKTELRKAGVKDAVIDKALENATTKNKVPVTMKVEEVSDV